MNETIHMLRVNRGQYLTMKAPNSQTMYMGFKNLKTAHKCKDFIENHRIKYGVWPSLNLDKDHEKIEMDVMSVLEPLYIENKTIQDVEDIMQRSGTGVMYCSEFGVIPIDRSFTITFRAQELQIELDLERYLESLEYTLDS